MSYTNNHSNTITFTDVEMDEFHRDSMLDLTQNDLEKRKGVFIYTAKVLHTLDENVELPPLVERDHYVDYYVYADAINPTLLIVEDEYDNEIFSLYRPKVITELDEIISKRNNDLEQQREQDDAYERERQQREFDEWDD